MTNSVQPVFDGRLLEPTHINAAGAIRASTASSTRRRSSGRIDRDRRHRGRETRMRRPQLPVDRGLIAWEKVYDIAPIVAG
jgi:hypothetical protein